MPLRLNLNDSLEMLHVILFISSHVDSDSGLKCLIFIIINVKHCAKLCSIQMSPTAVFLLLNSLDITFHTSTSSLDFFYCSLCFMWGDSGSDGKVGEPQGWWFDFLFPQFLATRVAQTLGA